MFMQRTRIQPALGKAPDVRSQLSDWVKHAQGKGRRVALGVQLFSSEGLSFVVTTLSEDLAGIEKIRQENNADADFQARAAKLSSSLAESIQTVVLEGLVAAPARTGTTISQIARVYPSIGKAPAVRQALEGFVRDRQGSGVTVALWQRIFSSDGLGYAMISRYADLSELDKQRQAGRQAVTDLGTALAGQVRAPAQIRVYETIVAMPPA